MLWSHTCQKQEAKGSGSWLGLTHRFGHSRVTSQMTHSGYCQRYWLDGHLEHSLSRTEVLYLEKWAQWETLLIAPWDHFIVLKAALMTV